MSMTNLRATLLIVPLALVQLLIAVPALAQGADETDAVLPPPGSELRARVIRKVRKARIEMLTTELALDPKQVEALDALLVESDKARLAARRQLREAREALRDALDAGAPEADLAALTVAFVAAEKAQQQALDDLFAKSESLLDARQQAAFRLVLPEFERKVRNLVRQAREKQRHKKKARQAGKPGRKERPGKGRGRKDAP